MERYDTAKDTFKLTLLAFAIRAMGLIFNSLLSRTQGTAAVGIMSLIFSFFGCIMVLANGNIFVSTSCFVSAEKDGRGSVPLVMKRSLTFSVLLSGSFSLLCLIFSDTAAVHILKSPELAAAVKMISFSLLPAAAGSCIKGYFHGMRNVSVPMKGDTAEFIFKWLCMYILLTVPADIDFYVITAAAIFAGESISFVYYLTKYIKSRLSDKTVYDSENSSMKTMKNYLRQSIPMVIGGYVQMSLSAANDLIVPAMLLNFSHTAEDALSKVGIFEAMIIPALFFPSAAMISMSNIIIPETSAAVSKGGESLARQVRSSLKKGFDYSVFTAGLFLCCGRHLGNVLCPTDSLAGDSLMILAPVIPFIYQEIILEGILCGLGKQNFCTAVSFAEYTVRILCVLIFVPLIGFGGVIVSYYASNCISNIIRMAKVLKEVRIKFEVCGYILIPALKTFVCCISGTAAAMLFPGENSLAVLIIRSVCAVMTYYLFFTDKKFTFGIPSPTAAPNHLRSFSRP